MTSVCTIDTAKENINIYDVTNFYSVKSKIHIKDLYERIAKKAKYLHCKFSIRFYITKFEQLGNFSRLKSGGAWEKLPNGNDHPTYTYS